MGSLFPRRKEGLLVGAKPFMVLQQRNHDHQQTAILAGLRIDLSPRNQAACETSRLGEMNPFSLAPAHPALPTKPPNTNRSSAGGRIARLNFTIWRPSRSM